MKASELAEALAALPPYLEVYIYTYDDGGLNDYRLITGARHALDGEGEFVELRFS
jgi:hypothetical protein